MIACNYNILNITGQQNIHILQNTNILTVPLANCCSAAKTIPPHLGHPCPGGALIEVVSGL